MHTLLYLFFISPEETERDMKCSCILKEIDLTGGYFSTRWAQWPPLHLIPRLSNDWAACFHSQKYIFPSQLLLIAFLSAFLQSCKYEACVSVRSVSLFRSPALSRWGLSLRSAWRSPGFHLFCCLFVVCSLPRFTRATLNCSAHQFKAADPERLQQLFHLLQPSKAATAWPHLLWASVSAESDRWGWAYEGRAAGLDGDPGLCISPGGFPVMDDSVNVCGFRTA